MLRVAVYDDSAEQRAGLSALVQHCPDMELAGAWASLDHLEDQMSTNLPHVVLMDISMPGADGIEGVHRIRSQWPGIQVLMQTVFDDPPKIFKAIKAGAAGYLLKGAGVERIAEAIREVHAGGGAMTPSIAKLVMAHFQQRPATADHGLSVREKEVLQRLVSGSSYKMIADELGVSYHTVNGHLKMIYRKLHVNSLGEAVAKALREGLVDE